MTLRNALLEATRRLARHGIPNPRLNAEVLLAHCIAVDQTYLYTHDERPILEDEYERFEKALYDRVSRVPLQYIVGREEFYGRQFIVTPAVLIPRPETEGIVEQVLQLGPRSDAAIIDVGTGSGCIGLTLALELPSIRVTIADVSLDALTVARSNAQHLGADADLVCMDLLDAVTGPFDFIVSNPPYINPAETSLLQQEVREHEPHVALFAPDEGFACFGRLVSSAEHLLSPEGYLVMEIGFEMEDRISQFFGPRWEKLPTKTDLRGIPRTMVARLR